MAAKIQQPAPIQFCLYQGTSTISNLIRWHTWSKYSHVSIYFPRLNLEFEANSPGIQCSNGIGARHPGGTTVDILEYKIAPGADRVKRAYEYAKAMCEAKTEYDFRAVLLDFPLRTNWEAPSSQDDLFCSEYAMHASWQIGENFVLCERTLPRKVSPEDINKSAILRWVKSIKLAPSAKELQ